MNDHDPGCLWPKGPACRKFSTDGTRLGADIAHTMGTTDEKAIAARGISDLKSDRHLTGMPVEQADWEGVPYVRSEYFGEWTAPTEGQGHLSECATVAYPGMGYACTCYDWSPES